MRLSVFSRDVMTSLLTSVDEFLRTEGLFARAGAERSRFWAQVRMVAFCGAVYGMVMGSFHGLSGDGWKQIALSALAPITELMNLSTASYSFMLFWSGIMFAVATVCGQWRMNSMYRPLIASNSRHRLLAIGWIALYWFVGIQMAWVLRPFVGSPGMPFQLLRPQAWGNAYVEVAELILRVLRR